MKRLTLVLAVVWGCTGWSGFRKEIHTFQDKPIADLVARLGAPDNDAELPGGLVTYKWKQYTKGGGYMCDISAVVEKESGRITKITDDCPNWK